MKKLMLAVVAALLAASAWARPSIFHLTRERCQTHKEAHCSGGGDIYGRAWNPDRVDIGAAVYDCKGLMLLLKYAVGGSVRGSSIRGVICGDLI